MNQDFGAAPSADRPDRRRSASRANFIDLAAQPARKTTVDINKYRPASEITAIAVQPQPVAAAITPDGQQVDFAINEDDWQSRNPLNPLTDDQTDSDDGGYDEPLPPAGKPPRRNPFAGLAAWWRSLSRKRQILLAAALLLLLGGGMAAALALAGPDDKPAVSVQRKKAAAPAPKPTSPLTGMEVSDEDTKRPVIGVMVENSTAARPQAGLRDAGVVYEAIAEYGITRFLALYQEANPANVGPVRSARPYYVDWARGYDAAYGHVGGSPDALSKIRDEGIRDLDQFANAGAYRRISERQAPHNVYTTGQQLRDLTAAKGWTSSNFTGLARKKEAASTTPAATNIDIAISGPTYNVKYEYDAASNSYPRTMGGQAHNDADSGQRITPKVVVALATEYGLLPDGYHSRYATTGSGSGKIFQDGIVTEVTWQRDGTGQYIFADTGGKPVQLNPGQTWFTLVGDLAAVTSSGPPAPATDPAPQRR